MVALFSDWWRSHALAKPVFLVVHFGVVVEIGAYDNSLAGGDSANLIRAFDQQKT